MEVSATAFCETADATQSTRRLCTRIDAEIEGDPRGSTPDKFCDFFSDVDAPPPERTGDSVIFLATSGAVMPVEILVHSDSWRTPTSLDCELLEKNQER